MAEGSRGRRSVSHVRGWLFAAAGFPLAFVGGLPADAGGVAMRAAVVRANLIAFAPARCAPGSQPVEFRLNPARCAHSFRAESLSMPEPRLRISLARASGVPGARPLCRSPTQRADPAAASMARDRSNLLGSLRDP